MNKKNLLIIDDELDILTILEVLFAKHVNRVFKAENGKVALEIIRQNQIDCIICDINMPEMNGIEVIAKIREMGNEVPIIFYSAYGNQDFMLKAGKYGAYDFICKPNIPQLEEVTINALKSGIDALYDKKNQTVDEDNFSEYQKLLKKVDEK
ncbi:MAG: hypothetical protein A2381_11725 [Bdellovibrionales bacterium RIFOXYB1_FULL_37_110]|nr:MAG: hypothetical protein A2181_05560 [Bdellovibrionales bacterium RIFOXYA1_FULL_38_20]OFZ49224.1 MAG: hypothetical protein A2417_16965 [Bdellovibrionales bacterium RIFOXYC1_FULL_37_79]OFZ58472.1 MAG: hypothetical protein A2381_11725 [Bdellovibrionales bacterium RIFOXYB1_FULL_37_110]OFZ61485.1 MAG: hypothetical protein A2577_00245 [Bdellovibrionales bacterium RIFOXYD1_FULL_36_51]